MTAAIAERLTTADLPEADAVESRDPPRVRALVSAARTGDAQAFGELVAMHEKVVFRTALAALGRPEDAEDATQDAFVLAWRKLAGFRGDSSFKTWLLTITWRKALDRRRVQRLAWLRASPAWSIDGTLQSDPLDQLATTGPDPERTTVSRDLSARVQQYIARLSPKLRDTLLLAATGEHSYNEIAVMLGVPLGTVKWRVAEARRLVQEKLDD